MSEINGKVVIISGAISGLGKATAHRLAKDGAKLVLAARREELLVELRDAIEAQGGEAIYQVTDVTDRAQVESLAKAAKQAYGRIGEAANGPGVSMPALAASLSAISSQVSIPRSGIQEITK